MNYYKKYFYKFGVLIILLAVTISLLLGSITQNTNANNQSYIVKINNKKINKNTIDKIFYLFYVNKNFLFKHKFTQIINNKNYVQQIKLKILSELINEIILSNYIKKLNFYIDKQKVKNYILNTTIFQTKNVFNIKKYFQILNKNNLTPEKYEFFLRNKLSIKEFLNIIQNDQFILNNNHCIKKNYLQIRKIKKIIIKNCDNVKITSKKNISSFYFKHQKMFLSPQYVKVQYICIDKNNTQIFLFSKNIKNWYNKKINNYLIHYKKNKTDKKNQKKVINDTIKKIITKKILIFKYHKIQKKIFYMIHSLNYSINRIQKKMKQTIHTTKWFTKLSIPSKIKFYNIKSIIFNNNYSNNHINYLHYIITNNNFFILTSHHYKKKLFKSIKDSKQKILSKLNYKNNKIKKNFKKIHSILRKNNTNILNTKFNIIQNINETLSIYNTNCIKSLVFLLPTPSIKNISYKITKDIKNNIIIIIFLKKYFLKIPQIQENYISKSIVNSQHQKTINSFLSNLYKKVNIKYAK